jgi:hypothetical protein
MLIRFCAATNSVDAARVGGKLAFDVLRFGRWDVVFADIDSPEMAGQAALPPDPDAFAVEL